MSDDTSSTLSVPAFDVNLDLPLDPNFLEGAMGDVEGEAQPTPEEAPAQAPVEPTASGSEIDPNLEMVSIPDYEKNLAAQEATQAQSQQTEPKMGFWSAMGVSTAEDVGPATAAMYGFGRGAAMAARLPIPHPLVKGGAVLVGGLIGAGSAAWVAKEAQNYGVEHLLPKGVSEKIKGAEAKARKDQPVASLIGEGAAMLPTMSFSPATAFKAAGIAKMALTDTQGFSKYIATPEGSKALGEAAGVVFGAGTQGAMEAVNQIQSGDYNVARFVGSVIIGASLNKETAFGAKLTGSGKTFPRVQGPFENPEGTVSSLTRTSAEVAASTPAEVIAQQLELEFPKFNETGQGEFPFMGGDGPEIPAAGQVPQGTAETPLTFGGKPVETPISNPPQAGEVPASGQSYGDKLYEVIGGNGPVPAREVLGYVANTPHPFSPLANEILALGDKAGLDVPVSLDGKVQGGVYQLSEDSVKLGHRAARMPSIVIHEIIHGLSSRKLLDAGLREGTGSAYIKNLKAYASNPQADTNLKNLINTYFEAIEATGNGHLLKGGARAKVGVGSAAQRAIRAGSHYGFGNLAEFIAEIGSNKDFQKLLSTIPSKSGNGSLWQSIVTAVRDFIGLSPQAETLMDRALRESAELMSRDRNEFRRLPNAKTADSTGVPMEDVSYLPEGDNAEMPNPNPQISLKIRDAVGSYLNGDTGTMIQQVREGGLINLETFASAPDTQTAIAAFAKTFEPEIAKAGGSIRSGGTVMRDVENWFKDQGIADVLASMGKGVQNSGVRPDTYYLASRVLLQSGLENLQKSKDAWLFNKTPENQAAMEKAGDIVMKMIMAGKSASSDAGRALASVRWSKKWLDMLAFSLNGENPLAALNKLPLTMSQKALGAVGEALVNSVLGWKSAVGNIIGGVGQSVIRPFEVAAGAKAMGNTVVFDAASKMYLYQLESMKDAFRAAMTSFKTLEPILTPNTKLNEARGGTMKNESQYGSPVDKYRSQGFISSETLGLDPKKNPFLAPIVDSLGEVFRFSQRLMIPTDEFFKTMNAYSMGKVKFHVQGHEAGLHGAELETYVKSNMERLIDRNGRLYTSENIKQEVYNEIVSEGLSGPEAQAEFLKRTQERMDSNVGEVAKFVKDFAEETTFQQKQLSTGVNGEGGPTIAKSLVDIFGSHPAARLATGMYFVNTPINIFRWTAQRFPVGITALDGAVKKVTGFKGLERMHLQYSQDMASGDPIRMASAKGKQATGLMIMGMAGFASLNGYLVGSGPKNKEENKNWRATGVLPYSFRIPKDSEQGKMVAGKQDAEDKDFYYIQFNRIDPVGTHLQWFSDFGDILRNSNLDHDASAQEMLSATFYASTLAASKLFFEKSTLTNIKQALVFVDPDNMKDFQMFQKTFSKYMEKRLSPVVVPSVISQITTSDDDTLNEARGFIQQIGNRLGSGISNELGIYVNKQRNVLGEPNEKAVLGINFLDAINPVLVSETKGDRLLEEFVNDKYNYSPPPRYHSPNGDKEVYDMRDFAKENGQDAYDLWQERTSTVKLGGKTLREAGEALIKSPSYMALPAQADVEAGYHSGRVKAKQKLIQQYRDVAFKDVLKEFPDFAKAYARQKAMSKASVYQPKAQANKTAEAASNKVLDFFSPTK
jgi:hypothetical protein